MAYVLQRISEHGPTCLASSLWVPSFIGMPSFMCERQLFAYLIPAFKNCEERGCMFCVKRQCSCLVSNLTFKALQENKLESIYLYLKVFLLGDKMT